MPEGGLKGLTEADWKELAYIVSGEAGPGDDRFGVSAAVLNRVASSAWPNSIKAVGSQGGQFEAVYTGKAKYDDKLAAHLKGNQGKIAAALKKLNGRDAFKGRSMYAYMGPGDIKFDDRGNFFHYRQQNGKNDPPPKNPDQNWKKWIQMAEGGFLPLMDGGGEYNPDGTPKDPRIKKRLHKDEKKPLMAGGGVLAKLGDGTKLASAPRGYCTTGVLETMAANGVANPPGTGSDGNNPRGLMVQAIKSYGWGSLPYGKPINLNSPYGKVGANMMNFAEWKQAVKGGNIPSGALVFSTRNANWNSNGPSSGHDSAIAKKGGQKLWSGHWQTEVDGVGAVYGAGTRAIVALTPGGANIKYDPSRAGGDAEDTASLSLIHI